MGDSFRGRERRTPSEILSAQVLQDTPGYQLLGDRAAPTQPAGARNDRRHRQQINRREMLRAYPFPFQIMPEQETYRTMNAVELWQKYQDSKAGKPIKKKEPETVGQWKPSEN